MRIACTADRRSWGTLRPNGYFVRKGTKWRPSPKLSPIVCWHRANTQIIDVNRYRWSKDVCYLALEHGIGSNHGVVLARISFGRRFIHQFQSPFTLRRAVVAQNVVEQFFPVDPLSPVNTLTVAGLGWNFAYQWKLTEVFLPVASLGACYLFAAFC